MGLIQSITSFNSEHNTISEYKKFMKTIIIYILHTLLEVKKKYKDILELMKKSHNTYAVRISTKLTYNPKHTSLLSS